MFVSLLVASCAAFGQPAHKRLSDWLLEQPQSPDTYPLGLSWRVPEETVSQTALFRELLKNLSSADLEATVNPAAVRRMRDWVGTMRVTGRVPVAVVDARWLQGNPARDPVLRAGQTVILPKRPTTVTLVTDEGHLCTASHRPGHEALAYIGECMPGLATETDWAWVVQPDGRVQRFGVATWNRQQQDEPAPGAWIWAPSRNSGWPEKVSHPLVAFLATQGPAPDPKGRAVSSADAELPARSRTRETLASDWGGVGLLQTPTARMAKTGAFSFHFSHTRPYSLGNIFMQPFDWMEAGFRYIDISNVPFGPVELSGSQSLKDKSIDAKFRLWSESAYAPEIAVGFRDLAGTGLFSGEYVVANKRTGDFDWSLGLGWGYVGARGDIRNPIGRFVPSFNTRKTTGGEGGNFAFGSYFRGPASFFGGVQYQLPWEQLILKVEYDGNNYQHEPQSNNQRQSSPLNIGMAYRASRSIDLTVGIERGNTVMFGLTFHTPLDGMQTPKPNDPPRVAVASGRPIQAPDWETTVRDISVQTDWQVRKIEQRGHELHLTVDDPDALYLRDRIDKAAAVLHRDAPQSVDRFALTYRRRGLEMAESIVDRDVWAEQQTEHLPPYMRREAVMARPITKAAPNTAPEATLFESNPPKFEAGLGFDYQQTLGGPDGFVLFQISAAERAKLRLRDDTWIQGTVRLGLLDNYDKFKFTAPSNLPRVRTFLREYLTTSALTMPNLQATHVGKLGDNQFYSVYGGYLEEMFAGVGAEWLYKSPGSRTAVGVDVNAVRQRKFEQNFGLQDYRVATGHATVYWDTGWQDVQARVSVGRYLAKDFGATLEVSRAFRNGVTIGAFATKTNVSAAQFGEGSFDKGIYLSVPFDVMLTRSTNSIGNFLWKPLTRDGGAMLARANPLYSLTHSRNERTLWYQPAPPPNDASMPSDRREEWTPKPTGPEPYLQVAPKPEAAQFAPGSNYEHRLIEELYRQGFRNITVAYDASHRLSLNAANDTLHPLSRAAGRAARTALRLSPLDTREIRITLASRVDPLVVYNFVDLTRLDRYFGGRIALHELAETVSVDYLDPAAREKDPLALLGDLDTTETSPRITEIVPGIRSIGRIGPEIAAAGRTANNVNWLQAGAIGTGLVLASSALDKRGFKFATDHANSPWLRGFNRVGNVLPLIGAGLVTVAALDGSDPRRSRTGFAALESAGVAFLASTGLKYATGRDRPKAGLGSTSFKPFSSRDSFPSRHAILAWAVATPFALEYDSSWRYGAAAVASLARVTRREHWMSDVVAGSLLGYGIGRIFWESSRSAAKGEARVSVNPAGVSVGWELD